MSTLPDLQIGVAVEGPKTETGVTNVGPFSQAGEGEFAFTVPGIAHFTVRRGQRITYRSVGDMQSVGTFLLGTALPVALLQRGFLVLEGTAINVAGHAIVLIGISGSGKSAVAARLTQLGHTVLSDGFCTIDSEGRVLPMAAPMKIWKDSAVQLGIDLSGMETTRPQIARFYMPLAYPDERAPSPVRHIYRINVDGGFDTVCQSVHGFSKFDHIRASTVQMDAHGPMGLAATHLKASSRLIGQSALSKINRPVTGMPIADLGELILRHFAEGASS